LAKIDWDTVSSFIEGIGATDKVITFPKVQDYVKVTNKGNVDIIYTVGTKTGTLSPNDSVEVRENISSITVRASSGNSEIYVRASEAGTEKEEIPSDIPADIAVRLNDVESSLAQKATKAELAALGQLKFVGVYATLSALQTAFPTGTNGIALVTADGFGYYWNGSAWTKGAQFQSTGIADNSLILSKMDELTRNAMSQVRKAFDVAFGTIASGTGLDSGSLNTRLRTTFIKVKKNDILSFSLSGFVINNMFLYDTSKTFTTTNAYPTNGSNYKVTTDGYIRLVFSSTDGTLDLTPSVDTIVNAVNFYTSSLTSTLDFWGYNPEKYVSGLITTGKNLFNKVNIITGYLNSDGSLNNNSSFYTTDFIKVSANLSYTSKTARKVVLYDSNKNVLQFVDNASSSNYTVTPTVDGFIRVSFATSNIDSMQIEKGSTATATEPFYYQFTYKGASENNPLSGKTILNLGDSIAWGANNNNGVGYADIIATNNMMSVYDYSLSGSTLADVTAIEPARGCIQKKLSDFITAYPSVVPDYILLEGGTNDILYSTLGVQSSGYSDSWDTTTCLGGLESILNTIKNTFPTSKVLFVAVHNMSSRDMTTQKNFHDAIIDVLNKWSIPVVDLYKEGGLNTWNTNMRTLYTDTGTHPNGAAYNLFYVPPITAKMKSL
jgi:lysophospholipase L1-like esterase